MLVIRYIVSLTFESDAKTSHKQVIWRTNTRSFVAYLPHSAHYTCPTPHEPIRRKRLVRLGAVYCLFYSLSFSGVVEHTDIPHRS